MNYFVDKLISLPVDAATDYIFEEFDELAWSSNWKLFNKWVEGLLVEKKTFSWKIYVAILCLLRQVESGNVPKRHQLIIKIESELHQTIGPAATNRIFDLIG